MAGVLGKQRTMMLQMIESILDAAKENPELIKQPHVFVDNSGGAGVSSGEGSMAVLGSLLGPSNTGQMLQRQNASNE